MLGDGERFRIGGPTLRGRRQRGALLLAVLAPLLLLGSAVALTGVDPGIRSQGLEEERTRVALARAKEALIHYAVADSNRPGELPCPDFDDDGRLVLNVDFRGGRDVPCATRRGWLPFRTLGVEELRDGTGERLWYAVGDIHHAGHSAPLNSEISGQLSVGEGGDVVAVIIAPGFPVDERQAREREEGAAAPEALRLASAFLEVENADAALDRYAGRARPQPGVNDRLLPITRRELAGVVEKRVIGEAALALRAFYRDHGTLPWLAPLGDLAHGPLRGVPGTRKGRLAFQRAGERVESAALHARWELSRAAMSSWGSVDDSILASGNFRLGRGPGRSGTPECHFVRVEEAECVASETVNITCRGVPETLAERSYRLRLVGDAIAVSAPDAARVRRRGVSVNRADRPGPISAENRVEIALEDVALSGPLAGDTCGAGAVTDAGAAWGYVELSEIDHPLELGAEVPAWFVDEGWHALTYVAFAAPLAPSAAPRRCEPEVDCLVLNGVHPAADKGALVVIAGAALPGQERGVWNVEAYFEGDNATLADDVFSVHAPPGELNDQIKVVVLEP